ncbi:MAG: hypothetical protein OXK80_02360 [Bdellovibrionales bacterium]|nr:hypothetical protein [Bdellovibrionales bacterium]
MDYEYLEYTDEERKNLRDKYDLNVSLEEKIFSYLRRENKINDILKKYEISNIESTFVSSPFDLIKIGKNELLLMFISDELTLETTKFFITTTQETDKMRYTGNEKKNKIYLVLAFKTANQKSIKYAEEHGVFVIQAKKNEMVCINKDNFKPKVFD